MLSLRGFMFERVYLGPHTQSQHEQARAVIARIFDHLAEQPDRLPDGQGDLPQRIADYIAGMTDRYALAYAEKL
jgi:dGTPase